jgi:hypothetical protein
MEKTTHKKRARQHSCEREREGKRRGGEKKGQEISDKNDRTIGLLCITGASSAPGFHKAKNRTVVKHQWARAIHPQLERLTLEDLITISLSPTDVSRPRHNHILIL